MGKASRRKGALNAAPPVSTDRPAPFVRRPFEGLPGETDWVALREIVPAATATVTLRADAEHVIAAAGGRPLPERVVITTVLPGGWPALRRTDGVLLLGLQGGSTSGDAARDYARVLLTMLGLEDGAATPTIPLATQATPRLQDLLDPGAPLEVTVHDGFDFWLAPDADLDTAARESLEAANETIMPTTKLSADASAYWVRMGPRVYLRWILPDDEDDATNALARMHAAGTDTLGADTRLLGAFRACGLLAPVWELDPELEPADYAKPFAAAQAAYAGALASSGPLTSDERRAKAGLLSRQLTLR